MVAFLIPWLSANAFILTSVDNTIKIFWFKLEKMLILPIATAGLCIIIEYSGLNQWLNKRNIAILTLIPLIFGVFMLTNDYHHFVWKRIHIANTFIVDFGPIKKLAVAYGLTLSLLQLILVIWLFIRSPRHRFIAVGFFISLMITRSTSIFNVYYQNSFSLVNPISLISGPALIPYAVAFFRLRMFDVVPVARNMAIDQIKDIMIVLDADLHIANINQMAMTIFSGAEKTIIGKPFESAFKEFPDLILLIHSSHTKDHELFLKNVQQWYHVSSTSLRNKRGFKLGQMIFMHNITEQKRIQKQLMENNKNLAILKERELLARELHDNIGQILAAIHMQLTSAKELLLKHKTDQSMNCLIRSIDLTQQSKDSIRDYLRGVVDSSMSAENFWLTLNQFIKDYHQNFGIKTRLSVSPELTDQQMNSCIALQLMPIIQEAFTNARKHGRAKVLHLSITSVDGMIHTTIEDDGDGLDMNQMHISKGFGLRSMKGRAEVAGGHIKIESIPDKGTRIIVQIPLQKDTQI
jgi:signal transduction histidine kinase